MEFTDQVQRRAVLLFAAASLACAPAGRDGESIAITGESAIIVWDAANKAQHFIRKADFRTEAKDFGFLVPTPGTPTLAEADNEAFFFLSRLTAPETTWVIDNRDGLRPMAEATAVKKGEEVRVIEEKKVAGYDAAVLEAGSAGALDAWLKKNGYHSSPELVEWFKPYIERRWKITAFKISKDRPGDGAMAKAVRMSFTTDRPFFPYREPKTIAKPDFYGRDLRIFFLGGERVDGNVGASDVMPLSTPWSAQMKEKEQAELFKLLGLSAPATGATLRLTEFFDQSSPRPGTDELYFSRSADQAEKRRPPIVRYISQGDALLLAALGAIAAFLLFLLLRKIWRTIRRA